MKAIIRKSDTMKHKATAKHVKLNASVHYTESLESTCYTGINTIFSSSHSNPRTGADPGFVGPEAHTILGALFKKKNKKLRIQNPVQ
jgi:hypothetical protein